MPLQDDDFEEVRKAVDPGLTSSQLPDLTINRQVFAGRAWITLVRFDPLAPTRTDPAQLSVVQLALILFTAANLIERIPFKRRERNGPYEYVNQALDPLVASLDLRSQGYAVLATLPGVVFPHWASAAVLSGGRGNVRETGLEALGRFTIGWPPADPD